MPISWCSAWEYGQRTRSLSRRGSPSITASSSTNTSRRARPEFLRPATLPAGPIRAPANVSAWSIGCSPNGRDRSPPATFSGVANDSTLSHTSGHGSSGCPSSTLVTRNPGITLSWTVVSRRRTVPSPINVQVVHWRSLRSRGISRVCRLKLRWRAAYEQNAQGRVRKFSSSSKVLPATLLCGFLLAVSVARGAEPAPSAQDLIAERVRPCTACHGKEGRATADGYYPRIAGKPAGYLLNEMDNFRTGRRFFPQMVYFMQHRDDTDLAEIAAYFAEQRLPYPAPAPPRAGPEALERGRLLVFKGNAALHVAACRSCHGSRLLGVEPAVPALLGLSTDYLLAQLGAWR